MKKFITILLCTVFIFTMLSFTVAADAAPTLTVSDAQGKPGDTVEIKLNIENNPGILAMTFCIGYDSTVLEYEGYKEGYLTNYNLKDHSTDGFVSFVGVEKEDISTNGTLLSLLFKIKNSSALGNYEINILNNNPEKYGQSLHNSFANSDEQFIVPTIKKGTVTITDKSARKTGDINGDNSVNNKDYALMLQYVSGWDISIDLEYANVNGDGVVNNKDCALFMQFLNGWDVELVSKPIENKKEYGNQGPLVFF